MDKPDALKIANAFKLFIKKYGYRWKDISSILKTSRKISFGVSISNIKGIFLAGGVRSPLLKNNDLHPKYYLRQIAIINEFNNHINPQIAFINNFPQHNEDGSFLEKNNDGNIIKSHFNKEVFNFCYWRHDNELGKGKLTLIEGDIKTALLEIHYAHKEHNIYLEGSYFILEGLITINLHDKRNKFKSPYTQITLLHNPEVPKHFCFGTFNTAHRGSKLLPTSGLGLFYDEIKLSSILNTKEIEDLATYILNKKRINVENSGFNVKKNDKSQITNKTFNTWLQIQEFGGLYEGIFINPKRKTYENCLIKINLNGIAEILVDANRDDKPYEGIVTIHHDKKVLIISYHYMETIQDFRMKLTSDISRYHPKKNKPMFGLMNGLEKESEGSMCSQLVLNEINSKSQKLSSLKKRLIEPLNLENKNSFKLIEKDLKRRGIYDFFYGISMPEFTSLALLYKAKQEFSNKSRL